MNKASISIFLVALLYFLSSGISNAQNIVQPPTGLLIQGKAGIITKTGEIIPAPYIYGFLSPTPDVNRYNLYRSSTLNGQYTFVGLAKTNQSKWLWYVNDFTIERGSSYYYRISAMTSDGKESLLSQEYVVFNLHPLLPISSPINNMTFNVGMNINFTWHPSEAFDVYDLVIQKAEVNDNYNLYQHMATIHSSYTWKCTEPGKFRWWVRGVKNISNVCTATSSLCGYFIVK